MKRMKTFLIYLLLVVAVIVLTDIIAKLILETNYHELNKYEIATNSPAIEITESKAGRVNGRLKGTVTNKTDKAMADVFVKVELKSKNNNILGTEYIKMNNLAPDQKKDFSLNYRYADVDNLIISTTNSAVGVKSIEDEPLYQNAVQFWPIARLAVWCITPAIYFLPLFLFTGK